MSRITADMRVLPHPPLTLNIKKAATQVLMFVHADCGRAARFEGYTHEPLNDITAPHWLPNECSDDEIYYACFSAENPVTEHTSLLWHCDQCGVFLIK